MDENIEVMSFLTYRAKNPHQVIDLSKADHRDRVTCCIGFEEDNAAVSRVIRLFRVLSLWSTNAEAICDDNAARGAFLALMASIGADGTDIVEEDGDIKAILGAGNGINDLYMTKPDGLYINKLDDIKW